MKHFQLSMQVLVVSLFCSFANGSEMVGDVVLMLPKSSIQTIAPQLKGTFQTQPGRLTIPGDFAVDGKDFSALASYQTKSVTPTGGGNFDLLINVPAMTFNMSSLSVVGFILKELNGVIVKIEVNINCQNVLVQSRKSFDMKGTVRVSNPFAVQIDKVSWTKNPSQWAFSAGSCVGPSDSKTFLEQTFNDLWNNTTKISDRLMAEMNVAIREYIQTKLTQTKEVPSLKSRLTISPRSFVDLSDNWTVNIEARVTSYEPCPTFERTSLQPQAVQQATKDFELRVPYLFVNKWLHCANETGAFNRIDYSKDLPEFKKLMSSTISLSAVWLDLLRFPTNAQFVFDTHTSEAFNFYYKNTPQDGGNPNYIYFNFYTNLTTEMRHIVGGREYPYVVFNTPVRGPLEARVANGKVIVRWFAEPTLDLKYSWVSGSGTIRTDMLQPDLAKAVAARTTEIEIAPIAITNSHELRASGIKRTTENIILLFNLKAK